jgi:hypothetical protein
MDNLAVASAALEALDEVRHRLGVFEGDDICEELEQLLRHERSHQRMGLLTIVTALCLATAALVLSMHPAAVPPMTGTDETALVRGRARAP